MKLTTLILFLPLFSYSQNQLSLISWVDTQENYTIGLEYKQTSNKLSIYTQLGVLLDQGHFIGGSASYDVLKVKKAPLYIIGGLQLDIGEKDKLNLRTGIGIDFNFIAPTSIELGLQNGKVYVRYSARIRLFKKWIK